MQGARGIQWEILRYLWLRGRFPMEGTSSARQLRFLMSIVQRTNARRIAEIGFNTGASSYAFLNAHPHTHVVAFDLNEHASARTAKKLIDSKFPGRHTLIYGDSRESVPEYARRNPDSRFDLVFIDGGHQYEVAQADLANVCALCTDETVVIMDDLCPWRSYGAGPARAWGDAVRSGVVRQDALFKDGKPTKVIERPGKRAWAIGGYIF